MPRELSANAISTIHAVNGSDPFLWLMRLYHPNFSDIYLVNNNVDVVSTGITYGAYAFQIVLHNDDGQPPKVKLILDNVDRSLIDEIRQYATPIRIDLKLILASNPDQTEISYNNLVLRQVNYNADQITGDIHINEVYLQAFPSDKVDPNQYPSVF